MRKIVIILLTGFCFASCKDKNALPTGILDKEKMQVVLWDVMRAEAFTNNFIKKDSTKNLVLEDAKLQHQIFAIHQVTKDEFYTSYDYYRIHPELMSEVLDSIAANNDRNGYQGVTPSFRNSPNHFPNPRIPFLRDSLHRPPFNHRPISIKQH